MQREEPYRGLTYYATFGNKRLKVDTGGAWLSSARVVKRQVKSFNERNPRDL